MAVPKAGKGRDWVFRMKGFVISHPAAGTCKNAREKREQVGMEWMRKKAMSRETGGFVNSAVQPYSQSRRMACRCTERGLEVVLYGGFL